MLYTKMYNFEKLINLFYLWPILEHHNIAFCIRFGDAYA